MHRDSSNAIIWLDPMFKTSYSVLWCKESIPGHVTKETNRSLSPKRFDLNEDYFKRTGNSPIESAINLHRSFAQYLQEWTLPPVTNHLRRGHAAKYDPQVLRKVNFAGKPSLFLVK